MIKKIHLKQTGFSLIEILTVLFFIFLLVSMTFAGFNMFEKKSRLEAASQEIIGAIKAARNKTLASEGASKFGVHFTATGFTSFGGDSFNPFDPGNENNQLNQQLVISQINLSGGDDIIFDRLSGSTPNNGYIQVESNQDSTQFRRIFIENSGTIGLAAAGGADTQRIKDSRHVHILFSQDTRSSSVLNFSSPPDGFSQNINYQDQLNPAKTSFLWEGNLTIGGEIQKIKIHSHSITETETLFCGHRYQRHNSKSLNIHLDGQNILNFENDGTLIQGTSPWAQAPEIQ